MTRNKFDFASEGKKTTYEALPAVIEITEGHIDTLKGYGYMDKSVKSLLYLSVS